MSEDQVRDVPRPRDQAADDGERRAISPPSAKRDEDKPQERDKQGENDRRADGDAKSAGDTPAKPPLYKRPLFWIIAGATAIVIAVVGLLWWLNARRHESTDDAFVDAHIVRLAPQISGQLTWVATDIDNRHVRAGQLLALIAPQGPQAQLQEAQAGIGEAEAGIAQAQGRLIAARAQRTQATADARGPEAIAARAARDYLRYLQLARLDQAAVAGTQIDQARTEAARTAAEAQAARQQVASADAQVLVARKGIDAATAQRQSAVARVAQSQVNNGYLRIVAPLSGQVVQRNVNVGSTVSPSSQMMAIVPDVIWITANFKEDQLALMRRGQHVDIKVDAFPGQHFDGHVDSIQRGAGQAFGILPPQNATGNYVKVVQRVPVRILFDRMPDPTRFPIGPGMSVVPIVTVR